MTLEDLAECDAEVIEPIKYDFKVGAAGDEGVTLWEVSWPQTVLLDLFSSQCPPNGQGLTALIALGIVEAYEIQHSVDLVEVEHNSTEYLHVLIEALRLAFADSELFPTR